MSEIRLASWNMLNALGDPERALPAFDMLMQTKADVV